MTLTNIPVPLPEGQIPQQLVHYTGQAGLVGIISTQELWATDIRFLNDSAEFDFARSLGAEIIERRLKHTKEPATLEALNDILDFARSFGTIPEAFVFSLSGVADDLGQWRAYGPRSGGYGLVFRGPVLAQEFGPRARLVRCAYNAKEQRRLISNALDSILAAFPVDLKHRSDEARLGIGRRFAVLLAAMAPSIKHPAFAAEKEWRVVVSCQPTTTLQRGVRQSSAGLLPFVRLPLGRGVLELSLASVIVGPMPDQRRETIAVRELLAQSGLRLVQSARSRIPYRTW